MVSPAAPRSLVISQYLFPLARYDPVYDVRDRSRFLHALLKGVQAEKEGMAGEETDGEDGEEVSGVVLRREQVKLVMLGKRQAEYTQTSSGESYTLWAELR